MREAENQLISDMPDAMQTEVMDLANTISIELDVDKRGALAAEKLKTELDKRFQPHWHVVIGNGFGSYVIHESQGFIYFKLRGRYYLLYKSGTGSLTN